MADLVLLFLLLQLAAYRSLPYSELAVLPNLNSIPALKEIQVKAV